MPAPRQPGSWLAAGLAITAALAFLAALSPARAQVKGNLFSDDFSTCEYYTNKSQIRLRLTGKRAQPSGAGKYLVKNLRIETYYEDGQPEFTLEAPDCLYDFSARRATSAGPLKISVQGDRCVITGEGFLWQQAESSLIISNQVRTLLRDLPAAKSKP